MAESPEPTPAGDEDVPLTPVERAMARRMAAATSIPVAGQWIDVRIDAALARVAELRGRDVPATFTGLVVAAVAASLVDNPRVGSIVDHETFRRRTPRPFGIGVAMASERGLVVPVLREVEGKEPEEVCRALHDLVAAVRGGAAHPALFEGGNITVTNIGSVGLKGGFAVPNAPQSAIVGVSSARQEPVVRGGEIVIGTVVTLSLTLDHRALDGRTCAAFLRGVATRIGDLAPPPDDPVDKDAP